MLEGSNGADGFNNNEMQNNSSEKTPFLRIETESDFSRSFKEKPWSEDKRLRLENCWTPVSAGNAKSHCLACTKRSFPVVEWLPKYDCKSNLVRDVLVGTTLAFVIAPKAMAHALLAGVPPVVGIYTAFISTLVYGLMGVSKWLSIGTAALQSLLYGAALSQLNLKSPDEVAKVYPMLTLYIGLFTLVMYFLRLDMLLRYVSPAVLSGFTTTAAFLIATSQVKYLFGVHIKADGFVQTYVDLFSHIQETNWVTLLLSIACLTTLFLFKKVITPKFLARIGIPDPGAIVVVLLSVGAVVAFELHTVHHVEVAGPTPRGLPTPLIPWQYISESNIHGILAIQGMIIAVINFVLAIALAKNFARKSKSDLRVSQELKALASVNTVGAFFGTQVAGGSFSGSAIIASLLAQSLIHNFINSFIMALILLVLTPMIELLPKSTLAAIVIAALPSLVDFQKPVELYKVRTDDFLLWVITFLITLFSGVQWGILSGIALSLLVLIYRTSRTDFTELGVLPGTTIYRSLERFPDAKRVPGIAMFRLDASLHFSNVEAFENHLETAVRREFSKRQQSGQDEAPHSIIINCEPVNVVDTTGIEMLCRIATLCQECGFCLYFSGWKHSVRRTLYAANVRFVKLHHVVPQDMDLETNPADQIVVPAPLDPSHWFLNLHDAVTRAKKVFSSPHEDALSTSQATLIEISEPASPPCTWPVLKSDGRSRQRYNSSPPVILSTTSEITSRGQTHHWQFAPQS